MIGCPAAGAGPAGQYTREAGFMAYYEVIWILLYIQYMLVNFRDISELSIRSFIVYDYNKLPQSLSKRSTLTSL
jgi:hypothetical protein